METVFEGIPYSEAKRMLRVANDRTMDNFIKRINISVIPKKKDPLTEILLNRGELSKALLVEELPEKFLVISEVAQILGISEWQVKQYCRKNVIPYRHLKFRRGSKLLFIAEEIEALQTTEIFLEKPLDYQAVIWRLERYKIVAEAMLNNLRSQNFINPRPYNILHGILIQGSSCEELGKLYDLSKDQVERTFLCTANNLVRHIERFFAQAGDLTRKNNILAAENSELRTKLKNAEDALAGKMIPLTEIPAEDFRLLIADTELSEKVKIRCRAHNVYSLGELEGCSIRELNKWDNFGAKSLNEITSYLKARGRSLKNC